MSSSQLVQEKVYPKFGDFVVNAEFKLARVQLFELLNEEKALKLPPNVKTSGKRWEKVFETMFNREIGQLKGYKMFKHHRNFRMFIEKVFAKALDVVNVSKITSAHVDSDVINLSLSAEEYFKVKNKGIADSEKRKANMNAQKEKIAENEDALGLMPKPAYIEPVIDKSPSTNNEGSTGLLLSQKVSEITNSQPMKKRKIFDEDGQKNPSDLLIIDDELDFEPKTLDFGTKTPKSDQKVPSRPSIKKVKPNRNIDTINYFDSVCPEIYSMSKNIIEKINMAVPELPVQKPVKPSKIDELQQLLTVQNQLKAAGWETAVIDMQINELLNKMKK